MKKEQTDAQKANPSTKKKKETGRGIRESDHCSSRNNFFIALRWLSFTVCA